MERAVEIDLCTPAPSPIPDDSECEEITYDEYMQTDKENAASQDADGSADAMEVKQEKTATPTPRPLPPTLRAARPARRASATRAHPRRPRRTPPPPLLVVASPPRPPANARSRPSRTTA